MTNKELPEAKTRRELITPALIAAGWDEAPHSYTEEETITDGRIIPLGKKARRREGLRADYVLRCKRDFKIAVVEAKKEELPADNGVQQAKDYAEMLGLKFAYATNGIDIIEIDFITGQEKFISRFPIRTTPNCSLPKQPTNQNRSRQTTPGRHRRPP